MFFKIAFRNVLRQKRRTILTMLTMFGGFTLASISIGWSDGTYSYIIDTFTRNQLGHIQVHREGYLDRPSLYKTIDDYDRVGSSIEMIQGVSAWSPRLYAAGLASVGEKSGGVRIIGIDPDRETRATRFDRKITRGALFEPDATRAALLGKGLATVLEADIGDDVVIVSQAADGSIANDLYHIAGIVESGDVEIDRTSLYLPLASAQQLFALENRVHEIIIVVVDLDRVPLIVNKTEEALADPGLDVSPWQEFAASFYRAMKADQQGMWISLFVIILLVAVGVLNTVLMSVLERIREYGLLKALGSTPPQVFRLIVWEVAIMAGASIVIGAGLSLFFNYFLSVHGVSLPSPLSYGGIEWTTMYSEINTRSFVIPAITVVVSAIAMALLPAIHAARTEPARAMRTH